MAERKARLSRGPVPGPWTRSCWDTAVVKFANWVLRTFASADYNRRCRSIVAYGLMRAPMVPTHLPTDIGPAPVSPAEDADRSES